MTLNRQNPQRPQISEDDDDDEAEQGPDGLDVSSRIAVMAPHCRNLPGQWPKKAPFLSQRHIKARPEFACDHLKHGDDFWKSVPWSDEPKLELLGPFFG